MYDLVGNINFAWLYYALTAIYGLTVVVIIVVVLSENRSPVKSLAWVMVLMLMPVLGIVLYLFFGRSIKNTRMISRRNRRRLRKQDDRSRRRKVTNLGLKPESEHLIKLTRTLSGSLFYPGNKVEVFTDGRRKFESLLNDINNAKEYINIQYYIIEDDNIGTKLQQALINKSRRGVKVRLIYDNVGSFKAKNSFFKKMQEAGVQAYPFFKVVFPPFGTRINWRNHRKICIIDGTIGYIGGMNVADRYIDGSRRLGSWRDTHLRITGPAVAALQYSFAVDWNFMGQPLIEDRIDTNGEDRGSDTLQMLTSGPTSQWTNIALLFTRAIASAKNRVFIQTPYFLPTESLLRALQTTALSGVDVRLMLPKHSDSRMLDAASASYIGECLQSGIKVYFYLEGMLHAKTLLVDDEFVSVGSTNFDFRSFEHNFESNMQIYSRAFNEKMSRIYYADLENCERINPAEWRKRPITKKILESITRLLSPIL